MTVKLIVSVVKREARSLIRNRYNYSMNWDIYKLHNTPENPTVKEYNGEIKGYSVLPYGFDVKFQYVNRIQKIEQRYKKFCHYMTETRHEWTEVKKIYWGDNSIDSVQVSKLTGETRNYQIEGPHGDVCF